MVRMLVCGGGREGHFTTKDSPEKRRGSMTAEGAGAVAVVPGM